MSIRGPVTGVERQCERVLRPLPEWFGIEESLVEYASNTATLPTFVAQDEGQLTGFLSLRRQRTGCGRKERNFFRLRRWQRRTRALPMLKRDDFMNASDTVPWKSFRAFGRRTCQCCFLSRHSMLGTKLSMESDVIASGARSPPVEP